MTAETTPRKHWSMRFRKPSRKALIVVGTFTIFMVVIGAPAMFFGRYNPAIASGASTIAAIASGLKGIALLSIVWILHAAMLLLIWCLTGHDFIDMYRSFKSFLVALPSHLRKAREFLRSLPTHARAVAVEVRVNAARVRSMDAADWMAFCYVVSVLLLLAAMVLFNWNHSTSVIAKLPSWLLLQSQDTHDRLFVSFIVSMFESILIVPLWSALVLQIAKRFRK